MSEIKNYYYYYYRKKFQTILYSFIEMYIFTDENPYGISHLSRRHTYYDVSSFNGVKRDVNIDDYSLVITNCIFTYS